MPTFGSRPEETPQQALGRLTKEIYGETQLLAEMQARAEKAYGEFDQRAPLQKVVSRTCPVCDQRVTVADTGHDTLGIGMSTFAAAELEDAYTTHVQGHGYDEVLGVIVALRREVKEQAERLFRQATPQPIQYAQAPYQENGQPYVQETRDEQERRLEASRQAQESYDPLKATPRYSDNLPAGVVGVRR